MKLATLAFLALLAVAHVSASPPDNVLTPSGIPATSGLPFSTLSFDTTAAPSIVSGLSSLISSESTALNPYTTTRYPSGVASTTPTPTPTPTSSSSSTTPTSTVGTSSSGARRSNDVPLAAVGLVLGAIAAFVC